MNAGYIHFTDIIYLEAADGLLVYGPPLLSVDLWCHTAQTDTVKQIYLIRPPIDTIHTIPESEFMTAIIGRHSSDLILGVVLEIHL